MRIGFATGSSDYFGHPNIEGADREFVGHLAAHTSPFASALPERVALSHPHFAVSCRFISSTHVCYYSGDNIASGFGESGAAFIGFEFFDAAGTHYGCARVRLTGAPNYQFQLVDYAWADAGEPLQTGQRRSRVQADAITKTGSLGLLAAGGAGLKAWRAHKLASPALPVR